MFVEYRLLFPQFLRQRSYHVEYTASRPISEVKQRWVWSVLGWVTAWEHQMLLAFLYFTKEIAELYVQFFFIYILSCTSLSIRLGFALAMRNDCVI